MDTERFPLLLKAIYDAVDKLERMFPGRTSPPDGHLVGSLGEALAAHYYEIQLATASAECHDGICGGRQVQVKATRRQGRAIESTRAPSGASAQSRWRGAAFQVRKAGVQRLEHPVVCESTQSHCCCREA
jgi:hypothetical protein